MCLTARLSQMAKNCQLRLFRPERRWFTDVARRIPVDSGLQIVVADDQLLDHAHNETALFLSHAHEAFAVHSATEDCFPTSDLKLEESVACSK